MQRPASWMQAGAVLLAILPLFWVFGRRVPAIAALGAQVPWIFISLSLMLTALVAFGFGLGGWLRTRLTTRARRIAAGSVFLLPYLIYAIPTGEFAWRPFVVLLLFCVGLPTLYEVIPPRPDAEQRPTFRWQDALVLTVLALGVMFRWAQGAWPHPGLGGFPKLLLFVLALYLYLVVRPLGTVGYDFRPRLSDLKHALREWVFFAPIAISLGLLLGFLQWNPGLPNMRDLLLALLVTFLFVAIPEEFFFRGVLQNLLERRIGMMSGLLLSSVLFGLSHFNKAALFNWRYVLLATIAGIFYGRAWRSEHRLLAAGITHTLVDVVWGFWFLRPGMN